MQTFLPYPSFLESARALDNKRLGKQRVETLQILNTLFDKSAGKGWVNHPAVRMWRSHEDCLAVYGLIVCIVWMRERGYADSCYQKIGKYLTTTDILEIRYPDWLGNDLLHESHRSNLLRKDPAYYSRFATSTRLDLEYVWPV